jgi:hypothetical protein
VRSGSGRGATAFEKLQPALSTGIGVAGFGLDREPARRLSYFGQDQRLDDLGIVFAVTEKSDDLVERRLLVRVCFPSTVWL